MRGRGIIRWVAVLGLLAGCGFDPNGEMPIAAPPVYQEWWARTEACSGLQGDLGKIEWFVIPGESFECPSGQCAGRWQGNRIYLSETWEMNELVVRHEMLHALLGRPGHPDPPFGNGCPLTWASWSGSVAETDGAPPVLPHID